MENVLEQVDSAKYTDGQEVASSKVGASVSNQDWSKIAGCYDQDMSVEERIKSAFLDVLARTSFSKIRMAEVASLSGTSRQNIYRYFSSKEEIFRAAVDDIFDEFYEKAAPFLCDSDTDFSYFFIFLVYTEVQKHSEVFISMINSGANELLMQQMRRYYRRFVGKIVREANVEVRNAEMLDYVGDIAVGSTFELLKRWVGSGMQETPQQMARMHSHFFNGRVSDLVNLKDAFEMHPEEQQKHYVSQ